MEPNDLKSPTPPDDAQFENWLRSHAALPTLPDDGFSHRVLTALPAPPRRTGVSPRLLAIGIGGVAGAALVCFHLMSGAPVVLRFPSPQPELTDALAQLADPKLHAALGVTLLSLVFVFWRDLRRRVGL